MSRAVIESNYLDAYNAADYLGMTYRAFDNLARRQGLQPDGNRGRARLYTRKTLDRLVQTIRDRKAATGSVVSFPDRKVG